MAKLTNTEQKVRDIMHQGSEPNWHMLNHEAADFTTRYVQALNWIHNAVEPELLRGELETLLRARRAEADVALVGDLDGATLLTLGKIAYCVNRGAQLAPSSILRIRNALDRVRGDTRVNPLVMDAEPVRELTAADRVNAAYKACYSRIDNVKARLLNGKIELAQVKDEVRVILAANDGDKAQVRKRLVEHYTQNLREALADKVLKSWVKPLEEIVSTLGGDVKGLKQKQRKETVKVKMTTLTKAAVKKPMKAKKATTKNTTKTVAIKPKRAEGKPTIAHQVRELIRVNKASTDEKNMVEIVIRELGLSKERGRSVVKAFWNKVGA